MKPESALVQAQHGTLLRRILGYVAAVVLPCLFTVFSFRTRAFHSTPLALSMAAIAVITILSGSGPGTLAAAWTALFFNYELADPAHLVALGGRELSQTAAVLVIGLLIVFFFERQYVIDSRLRVALTTLRAQTDALIEAQQASSSVAWTFDEQTQRLNWAEGGAQIFGRSFDDPSLGATPIDLVMEDDRAFVQAAFLRAAATGTPVQLQFRCRWPNGEVHWLECRGTLSDTGSRLWRGVTMDITERKNAELALLRSEKLAAIGRLSATIAHEMNNPLEAVTNLLYLSTADTTLPPQTRAYLARADEELRRLSSIARHTLTFARMRSTAGPVHTAPIVESVVAMFQPRCSSRGGEIHVAKNPDLSIATPADDLRQILTNLISNACDALTGSAGIVEVELSTDEDFVLIEVRDNGVGIGPENLSRIFDPFFTTKEDVGTGIGLWVTRELVEKNDGKISVRSDGVPPGFRTVFEVRLPLSRNAPVAAPEAVTGTSA